MAPERYLYNIREDTMNGVVNMKRLVREVKESPIREKFSHADCVGGYIFIYFIPPLGCKPVLDNLIAAHTGEPNPPGWMRRQWQRWFRKRGD